MKRVHIHVSVPSLPDSIRFYSQLFGAAPSVEKADYAKWMLEDPRLQLENRIRPFVSLPLASLDRVQLKSHLEEIGKSADLSA
jgi:hypothetical protein